MPFWNPETGEPSPPPSVPQELPDTDTTSALSTVTQKPEVQSHLEKSYLKAWNSDTQPLESVKATPEQIQFYKKYKINQVRLIQDLIGVDPDGTAGNVTVNRVIDFQKQHGLIPDGKVWRCTLWKMVWERGYGYKVVSLTGGKWKLIFEAWNQDIDEQGNYQPKKKKRVREVADTSSDHPSESHYEDPPSSEAQERASEVISLAEVQQSLKEIWVDSHLVTDTHLDLNVWWYHSTIQLTSNGRVRFHSDQSRGRENVAFDFEAMRMADVIHNIQTCIQIQQKSEALARATQDTKEDFMGDNFDSYQEVNRLSREIDNLKKDLMA